MNSKSMQPCAAITISFKITVVLKIGRLLYIYIYMLINFYSEQCFYIIYVCIKVLDL